MYGGTQQPDGARHAPAASKRQTVYRTLRADMEPSRSASGPDSRKHIGVGFWIWWLRPDRTHGGPSQVWMLVLSKHRRWAYVEFEGTGVWVHEDRITEVVSGSGLPRKNINSRGDR